MEQNIDTAASSEFKMVKITTEEIVAKQQAACDSQKHLAKQTLDGFDP